ncbi:hypothetical protein QFC22_002914 [Naganishia vaughanmartiniae]|uniref:Uncharacterized protein n=1 Tax=Naganishia vaughanmartiniae TaxID=1424756 RepID=A0ACC2XB64_9TREE|nr:hypothetical protein QFC22_002914 [Naganishia vaughanmartiniae]
MPLPLPNLLIYLGAFVRPTALKPHLRVASVSHVDWTQLRREGYNAVVIDKDNCLTYPHRDSLDPSITKGWRALRAAFGPGNVLVVSNSAGTRSDIGGIAVRLCPSRSVPPTSDLPLRLCCRRNQYQEH